MIDPVSPWPAVACLALSLLSARVIIARFGEPPVAGRFVAIDGLRGYLALAVFLHHAATWYYYARDGRWQPPPSNLYTHFGHSGVALFFMITGFLFYTKVLNSRGRDIDWTRLFVSRALRLAPLYLFSVLLLFIAVATLSRGIFHAPFINLVGDGARWLGFTIFGAPDLNGVADTKLIVAGVTWSLPYEWLFYLSLPLLALTVGHVAPTRFMLVGLVGLAGFAFMYSGLAYILAFGGGIFAAVLVRRDWFRAWAPRPVASVLVLGAFGATVAFFPTAHSIGPLILLSIAFALIAGGNTLFGALSSPVSRTLGEMAYGIYLLHGIVLFALFNFLIGRQGTAQLSAAEHWGAVLAATPFLVALAYAAFRLIEHPAMLQAVPITNWLRSRNA